MQTGAVDEVGGFLGREKLVRGIKRSYLRRHVEMYLGLGWEASQSSWERGRSVPPPYGFYTAQ